MAQLQLTNDSSFYKLITGALLNSNGRYESLEVFFRDEFNEDAFPTAKWKELFEVAEENRDGVYTQVIGTNTVPVMAAYVAYDAEGQLIANEGFKIGSDTMPRMKIALNFNEKSIRDGEFLMSRGGTPEWDRIFRSFNKNASDLIAGCETLRSYTALQVESTGGYVTTTTNNPGGLINLKFDFLKDAPTTNRKTTGGFGKLGKKYAWTDPNAYPLGDLRDMYDYYTDTIYVPVPGVFRMNKTTSQLLLNHPTTINEVKVWKTGGLASPESITNYIVTKEDINEYITTRLGLPRIEVEKWHGISETIDPKTQKIKRTPLAGFADNIVLLRPEGYVGDYQWQSPMTMFATSSNPMYLADGGKIGVQQEIYSGRKAMQFTAESTGIPVPRNVDYFLYLDVTK